MTIFYFSCLYVFLVIIYMKSAIKYFIIKVWYKAILLLLLLFFSFR